MWLVRLLLANNKLRICVKIVFSTEFRTTINSPRKLSSSSNLHMLSSLSSEWRYSTQTNPPISSLGMPVETEYAGEVDFIDEEKIYIISWTYSNQGENETSLRGDEDGRKRKILRSMLSSFPDRVAHCVMGTIVFQVFWKIWMHRRKIHLTKMQQVYLSWCSNWADPKTAMDDLDPCHHKHLRIITGHWWPMSQGSVQDMEPHSNFNKGGTTTMVYVWSCTTDAQRNTCTKILRICCYRI